MALLCKICGAMIPDIGGTGDCKGHRKPEINIMKGDAMTFNEYPGGV